MSLNLIINGLIEPGDHIITTALEHNSVIRPVNHMVRKGAEATYVAPDTEGYLNPEDIRKAMKPNTKLVIVNHGSNVIGVVQDLKSIGAICKECGVPLAVDAAQTAGIVPIDMAEWNISFLAFTGHKCLMAPTGTGGICVADDAEIEGTIYGGTGVQSINPYHLTEYPYRLEAGTLNLAGVAGLFAGVSWLEENGVENLYRHEMELFAILQEGLAGIPGVKIWGTKRLTDRVATMSITVDKYDPSDIGTILDVDMNVFTRTGLQCAPLIHKHLGTVPRGTIRFSIGPFNTKGDIETAVKGVAEISARRNGAIAPTCAQAKKTSNKSKSL
jgi:cysteine desulfurase family protein